MRTLTLALVLILSAGAAAAQENPAPADQPPATTAAPADAAAEKTASPDLVGQLVKELGITPKQAEGTAGTLFGVAKGSMKAEDFGKVAAAVPDMDALLKAAPAPDGKASAVALLGGAGGAGGMAAAASTLSKLGLKPETIAKAAPALVKIVQGKGGAEVGSLLAAALK
jgi:uncharacterized protein VcgC/VcgE DUF2780